VKKIVLLSSFFIALFAAVIAGPGIIDWNQYKDEIQDQIRDVTGRNIKINGDISITILPAIALVANDVSLANINGAKVKNLLQLSSLEVRVALAPLLGGLISIEKVTLVDPVIELEVLPDGRNNWMLGSKEDFKGGGSSIAKQAQVTSPESKLTSIPKSSSQSIALDSLSVENGTIIYRDSFNGAIEKIEAIDAKFSAASTKGPLESSGGFKFRGVPINFDLNVGEIIHGRTVAFALKTGAMPGSLKILLAGTLSGLGSNPRIKGSIKGEAKSLEAFIIATQGSNLPNLLDQPLSFEANIKAQADGAEIKGLELNLGNAKASGSVDIKISKIVSITTRIVSRHINVDKLLSSKKSSRPSLSKSSSQTGSKASLVLGRETENKLKNKTRFIIPKSVQASLTLIAEAITYRGEIFSNGRINAELSNGEITLSQASAQFPGGSDVALFGFVTSISDKPQFEGELESTVNDLRGFLSWLGYDLDGIAKDRLRKLSLKTRVFASQDQIKLKKLKLHIDSSKLNGGITLAMRKRPSFGVSVRINKLNLDAYLPKKEQKAIKKETTSKLVNNKDKKKTPTKVIKNNNQFQALKLLNDLDANIEIQVKSLMFREQIIKNAVFDGTLYNGSLDIRRLSTDQLGGSRLFAKGRISNFGNIPKATGLSLKAETKNVNQLFRFAGLNQNSTLKEIGVIKFIGQIDGSVLTPNIKIDLDTSSTLLAASGQLDVLSIVPAVKGLKFQIKAKSTSKFLKLAGIKAITAKQLGAVDVDGEINGNLISPSLAFNVKAVGGIAAVSGKINTLPIGETFDLSLRVSHPEMSHLIRSIGGYKPVAKVGPIDIQGQLIGSAKNMALKGITAKAGNIDLRGNILIGLEGQRPQIKADLTSGKIIIDPFLPKKRSASYWRGLKTRSVATRSGVLNWSIDPIDLSGMADIDASVILKSPSINYKGFNLKNADLSVSIEKGFFRTNKFTGLIFEGLLEASIESTLNSRPQMKVIIDTKGVDLEQATSALNGAPIAGGTMGLQVSLNSAGSNEAELVSGLSGNGLMQFNDINVYKGRNGTMLAGALGLVASMNQVSGLLGNTKKASGLVDISGSFVIRRGVAKSSDLRIISDLGDGEAKGVVNIPKWGIDVKGNVKLGQNILTDLISRSAQKKISQKVPFAIYGKLDAPNIKLDTSKITGGVLHIPGADKLLKKLPKGVGGVLEGLLGGRPNQNEVAPNAGETTQPSKSQQQQRIDPVDIMKEIFRRR